MQTSRTRSLLSPGYVSPVWQHLFCPATKPETLSLCVHINFIFASFSIHKFSGEAVTNQTKNVQPGQCYDFVQPQVGFYGAGYAKLGEYCTMETL